MKVLIVDDDPSLRRLLKRFIESQGDTVIEASSAEEGLTLARAESTLPVAFCDIRLPGRDGLWLVEQLAWIHPETVVVITTGVLDLQVAVSSLRAGAVDYLVKPFSREQLVDALGRGRLAYASRSAQAEVAQQLREREAQVSVAFAELQQTDSLLELATEYIRATRSGQSTVGRA